jgi:putative nucleotidyltransferase with HDIG domain
MTMVRPLRVGDARELAATLLDAQPERWRHTVGVAHRAEELADTIGADDPVILISAAWLHDIGYAPALRETGFHPLDAARHLEQRGWPRRLVGLVAHHSGAAFVAVAHGLSDELVQFPGEHTAVSDALTYADQTVGPDGRPMTVPARVADMLARHGVDSPNARVHEQRGPFLEAVAERTRFRLSRSRAHSGREWE